jgi:glucan phosphorylase
MHYDKAAVKESIRSSLGYHFGVTPEKASDEQIYKSVAMTVNELLAAQHGSLTSASAPAEPKSSTI